MSDVPSSVLVALWANAVLAGEASATQAADQVQRDGDPHQIRGSGLPFSATPGGPYLLDWFDALRDGPTRGVRAVLPAPGDVLGVPAAHVDDVLASGEAVVTMASDPREPAWLLVPEVTLYGSALEYGEQYQWQQSPLTCAEVPRQVAALIGASEADRHLSTALLDGIEQLGDAPDWLPGAGRGLPDLGQARALSTRLPRSLPVKAMQVLARGVWVRDLVSAAIEDGAVGGWDGTVRERVLRNLDTVARQAMVAVTVPKGLA